MYLTASDAGQDRRCVLPRMGPDKNRHQNALRLCAACFVIAWKPQLPKSPDSQTRLWASALGQKHDQPNQWPINPECLIRIISNAHLSHSEIEIAESS